MTFLEEYDALEIDGIDPTLVARARAELVGAWLAGKPAELFAELRAERPIFATPALTFVTKYADVLEVLARDEFFSVRPYAPKMERIAPTGFILGMDDTPHYQNDVSVLRLAFHRNDLPRIRDFIVQTADQLIREVEPHGRIDLVPQLSRLVPTRLVGQYFGVPGPDEATLMRWARTIFYDLFLNLRDVAEIREPAIASAAAMRPYLNELIAARGAAMAAGTAADDDQTVLHRLLQMQCNPATSLSNARIRDNLIGMIVGAIDTNSKAIVHIIDELLRRPDALSTARAAALADDDAVLTQHIHEALRFNPQNTGLVRFCERPYVVAKDRRRATLIPTGALVFVATSSAMFDASFVDEPESFRTDRSLDLAYLHFGSGLHSCAGQYMSRLLILGVVKRLLLLPGLRRADGSAGQVQYSGPFPESFSIEFDPVAPAD
ncbi:MAG TPA: cytochrome P450 [Abditibacteriaceae bacterium]|nr:cytochrome P450 [Abditibacteriaceae bacterium]